MKPLGRRSIILTTGTLVLLVALVIGWYSYREHIGPGKFGGKSATEYYFPTTSSHRTVPLTAEERRRQESISLAAQKWYEELLEQYPAMKPQFREVPDADNGFLQLLILCESMQNPELPQDIEEMLIPGEKWDPGMFASWLADNQEYVDQIVRVAELPDQSAKGQDLGRLFGCTRPMSGFGKILRASARLAFENGDRDSALRYTRAAMGLANHLTEVEVPSVLGTVIATGYVGPVRDSFLENIMPALSGDPHALAAWREALFPKTDLAEKYAGMLKGELNVFIRTQALPAFLGANVAAGDAASFKVPDSSAYIEEYTAAVRKLAAGFSASGPGRLDLTRDELEFPESGIDPQTLRMLRDTTGVFRGIFKSLGLRATREAMIAASIAVQLDEAPGIDPVTGKPFQWNPNSRTLLTPKEAAESGVIEIR